MPRNLRGILARVERVKAAAERAENHDDSVIVTILHEGRRRASLGLIPRTSPEDTQARIQELRQKLREEGFKV